jgi:hypothetical protein
MASALEIVAKTMMRRAFFGRRAALRGAWGDGGRAVLNFTSLIPLLLFTFTYHL